MIILSIILMSIDFDIEICSITNTPYLHEGHLLSTSKSQTKTQNAHSKYLLSMTIFHTSTIIQ